MRNSEEFNKYLKFQYDEAVKELGGIPRFDRNYSRVDFENDVYKMFAKNILGPRENARRAIKERNSRMRTIGKLRSKKY